jgi:hypothetical protein
MRHALNAVQHKAERHFSFLRQQNGARARLAYLSKSNVMKAQYAKAVCN